MPLKDSTETKTKKNNNNIFKYSKFYIRSEIFKLMNKKIEIKLFFCLDSSSILNKYELIEYLCLKLSIKKIDRTVFSRELY